MKYGVGVFERARVRFALGKRSRRASAEFFGAVNGDCLMVFDPKQISLGSIAHEATHCVQWLRMCRKIDGVEAEAQAVGDIFEDTVVKLLALGWLYAPKADNPNNLFNIGRPVSMNPPRRKHNG